MRLAATTASPAAFASGASWGIAALRHPAAVTASTVRASASAVRVVIVTLALA